MKEQNSSAALRTPGAPEVAALPRPFPSPLPAPFVSVRSPSPSSLPSAPPGPLPIGCGCHPRAPATEAARSSCPGAAGAAGARCHRRCNRSSSTGCSRSLPREPRAAGWRSLHPQPRPFLSPAFRQLSPPLRCRDEDGEALHLGSRRIPQRPERRQHHPRRGPQGKLGSCPPCLSAAPRPFSALSVCLTPTPSCFHLPLASFLSPPLDRLSFTYLFSLAQLLLLVAPLPAPDRSPFTQGFSTHSSGPVPLRPLPPPPHCQGREVSAVSGSAHTLVVVPGGAVWTMGRNDSQGGGGHGSPPIPDSGQLGREGGRALDGEGGGSSYARMG